MVILSHNKTSNSPILNSQLQDKQNSVDLPSVTVAIPAFNEVKAIERVIQGFIDTTYVNIVEILIADGGSTDGTQEIIKKIGFVDSRVRLIHNALKIQSAGLNLLLQEAQGDIFLRADAHSDYAYDYVERCVEALLKSKALNVGGAQRFVARSSFQAGAALAARSLLGNGGAKYRNPEYNGYADTVYLGCFWQEDLLKIAQAQDSQDVSNDNAVLDNKPVALFDISQITNQDAELNQRLLDRSSQAIYVSSDIKVWYYPRSSWKSLWQQYFKYGRGRYLTTIKHNSRLQIRGQLPFIAISIAILLTLVSFIVPEIRLPITMLFVAALLAPFFESLRITIKYSGSFDSEIWRGEGSQVPSLLARWLSCSVSLITMPLAHFCGYGYQLYKYRIIGINGW